MWRLFLVKFFIIFNIFRWRSDKANNGMVYYRSEYSYCSLSICSAPFQRITFGDFQPYLNLVLH